MSAPTWIVTFSDMISLLVTFFVLLVTFSTLDDDEQMILRGAFGANRGGIVEDVSLSSLVERPRRDRMLAAREAAGGERPHARPAEELPANLEEMGQKQLAEELALDLTLTPDGLLVSFAPQAEFALASAEPPAELERSLRELAAVAAHYPHMLVVEGHFDATSEAPALALERASAAARALLASGELPSEVVQISAANVGGDSEALSRRVDVRILALGRAQARALELREGAAR